jgi:hypothetical protein
MRIACTFPTFTKHCVKASIIVAAALSVSTASARPIQVLVKPGTGQASVMHRGIQMAASSGPGSEIWILTAEPDEGKRVKLAFVFVNNSDRPITIGPESITAETLTVVPWEVLAQEQRRREGRRKFGNFLAGLGNSISAANAGYSHGSFHYSGFNSRGTHYTEVH